jgi:tryptophan-rich sensory protein
LEGGRSAVILVEEKMEAVQQSRRISCAFRLNLFYLVTFIKTLIWSRLVIKNKSFTGYLVDGLLVLPLLLLVLYAVDITPI